ncbi:glutamate receptor U1-like [Tubulanus polymorphus]|uniref:glutamate receptor U1-like n=1 Tax=Tubulanus polymorphus TaxID=672921 RepID=UPI003DA2FC6D
MSSISLQGNHDHASNWSTRILMTTWWGFSVATFSIYIVFLNQYATIKAEQPVGIKTYAIPSFDDIVADKVPGLRYGMVAGSEMHRNGAYRYETSRLGRVFAKMQEHPTLLSKSIESGLSRVGFESFALVDNGASLRYHMKRRGWPCGGEGLAVSDIRSVPGLAFALPIESKYLHLINLAILELIESGKIDELKRIWWGEDCDGVAERPRGSSEGGPGVFRPLELTTYSGIAIYLLFGIVSGYFIALVEIMINRRRRHEGQI